MRGLLVGFVAGCWLLQQQAGLLPGWCFAVLGVGGTVLLAWAVARR